MSEPVDGQGATPEPEVTLTVLNSISGAHPKAYSAPLSRMFSTYFETPRVLELDTDEAKKSLWMYTAALYAADCPRRHDDHVMGHSGLLFDIDCKSLPDALKGKFTDIDPVHPDEFEEEWAPYTHMGHFTWSHTAAAPRFRVFFPFSRAVMNTDKALLKANYAQLWVAAWSLLFDEHPAVDPSAATLSISFFGPSVPKSRADEFEASWVHLAEGGALLDPDTLIAQLDGVTAQNRLTALRRDAKARSDAIVAFERRGQVVDPAPSEWLPGGAAGTGTEWTQTAIAQHAETQGVTYEGGRNNQLFQDAKDAFRGTRDRNRAWGLVTRINAGYSPPLPDSEVEATFRSAERSYLAELGQDESSELKTAPDPVDVGELSELQPIERTWAWEDNFPKGHVTGLFANGGTGKSLMILQLAVCRAARREFVDGKVPPVGKTLIVSCEDDTHEILARLRAICDRLGVPYRSMAGNIFLWDRTGQQNSLMEWSSKGSSGVLGPFYDELKRKALEIGADLVAMDTRDDFFTGAESDNPQIRQFVQRTLVPLASVTGAAVVFLGHISSEGNKKGGSSLSGGLAWRNTTRCQISMLRGDDGVITIKREKSNYAQNGEIARVHLDYPILANAGTIKLEVDTERQAQVHAHINTMVQLLHDPLSAAGVASTGFSCSNQSTTNAACRLFKEHADKDEQFMLSLSEDEYQKAIMDMLDKRLLRRMRGRWEQGKESKKTTSKNAFVINYSLVWASKNNIDSRYWPAYVCENDEFPDDFKTQDGLDLSQVGRLRT